MLKIFGIGAIAAMSFTLSLVAATWFSGNLNREAFMLLIGQAEPVAEVAVPEDAIGPVARRLRQDREDLDQRRMALDVRETRLDGRELALQQMLANIEELQLQLDAGLQEVDAEHELQLDKVAKRYEAMDKKKAAETLELLSPEEAAEILSKVKDRASGKILDEMEVRQRSIVMQIMAEPRF